MVVVLSIWWITATLYAFGGSAAAWRPVPGASRLARSRRRLQPPAAADPPYRRLAGGGSCRAEHLANAQNAIHTTPSTKRHTPNAIRNTPSTTRHTPPPPTKRNPFPKKK